MANRIELIGDFEAKRANGQTVTLYMFHEYGRRPPAFGTPSVEVLMGKQLKTEAGEWVNRIEKGKYQVAVTGEILTSEDPDAP